MNRFGICFCVLEGSLAPWGVRGAPTLHPPLHSWRMHTRGSGVSQLYNTRQHWKVIPRAVRASSAVTDQEQTERQRDIQLQMQRCHSMDELQKLIRAGLQNFDARLASTAVRLGIVKSAVLLLLRPPQRTSVMLHLEQPVEAHVNRSMPHKSDPQVTTADCVLRLRVC